jgi:hypothetical protein
MPVVGLTRVLDEVLEMTKSDEAPLLGPASHLAF